MREPALRGQDGLDHPNSATKDVFADWAGRELAFWRDVYKGGRDFSAAHAALNETQRAIFLFDIAEDRVTLRAKPAFYSDEDMAEAPVGPCRRARFYRDFLAECAGQETLPPLTIAIDVGDIAPARFEAPVFAFQKPRGTANILLPDIDFLRTDHYAGEEPDPYAVADKRHGAVFAGASTGGQVTMKALRDLTLPRLRLADELVGHPDIDFRIARAVQCANGTVQAELEARPYFGPHIPFAEQLAYRFVISVDGNGATCSRIVRTLRSRSVLMKGDSENLLYYFHGLQPHRHYLPFAGKAEIEAYLALDKAGNLDSEAILAAAQHFHRSYLTRKAVVAYGRTLLAAFAAWQTGVTGGPTQRHPRAWRLFRLRRSAAPETHRNPRP
ncbi:hypothetical protein E3C22_11695 [Jiella endophytica]|uniref:Glycosyl transferase CAP10 domain-containing protein n=1 Tax=Jiella endophytica TaxID=2558362 RepID=A0A4Y8RJZ1_9HYPH|nr:hypothetical protein E3C22_11695 [Jiella endophytica]